MIHIPVLLSRVIETLGDISGKTIVDATFGAGGYSRAFLERGANVIAFDRDPTVQKFADELSVQYADKFIFINAPFSQLGNLVGHVSMKHAGDFYQKSPYPGSAYAIVFDFGISSMQIDTPERGFSWRFDAPLDMRMSAEPKVGRDLINHAGDFYQKSPHQTAADLIESKSFENLTQILRDYGDVKKAVPIARAMKEALPQTTFQLRDLIHNPKDIAPVFQALRIAVNDELGEIERALAAVPDLLSPDGICACVTFHSLEDRLVKQTFRKWTTPPGDSRIPSQVGHVLIKHAGGFYQKPPHPDFTLLKTFRPDDAELTANPRARSAHLRVVRKI